ncbi:MAG: glycosyltransferase involved in cell wall biosynthesis [Gammaproteobacteria bacterium]|jgi:glycosyltransferase involved in cell wall biosynthesis
MIQGEPLQVSVVIGVRNGGEHLLHTVRSVCEQEGVVLECIVVDDGSSDGSANRVAALACADRRIRLIHQRAAGLTRALITGCAEARAPLIARIDVGDQMLPGRLARQCALLREHAWIQVLGSLFRELGPGGEHLADSAVEHHGRITDLSEQQRSARAASLVGIAHFCVCFRTDTYRRCGGYRWQFALAQDVDLWARMAQFGGVARLEEVLTLSRLAVNGLSPRHHRVQLSLREIATAAVTARACGGDERPLLKRAYRESTMALNCGGEQADAAYYVASRLAHAGHGQAAMRLYRRALQDRPANLRHVFAWLRACLRQGMR